MNYFLYTILNINLINIFKIFSLLICFYIFYFYYKHFTRVNPLPGPMPIPFIGNLEIFKPRANIDSLINNLCKRYGQNGLFELNMLGSRNIIITRAEYMNELMTLQTASTGREKYFRKFPNDSIIDFYDLDGKGVAFHDNYKFWKFNRQILSHSIKSACLSSETSRTINNLFEEMANYWINLKKPDDSIIIDVPVWMRRFINEFMSTVTTGNRTFAIKYYYQKLKNEITNEILESQKFIDSVNYFFHDNALIYISKILTYIPSLKVRTYKLKDNLDFMYKKLTEIVRKRRKEIEKIVIRNGFESNQLKNDLLTSMIIANTQYEIHPQKNVDSSLLRPMTDNEIRGNLFDLFTAGTDSTATTVTFALYNISHHPNVKKKLCEEIDAVFKDDPTRPVTLDDLTKLKYCEAIIKETGRLRPTVSAITRYCDQPDEIAGCKWPADTLFIVYVRGINNNPSYWKDPEKFIPERFYESQETEDKVKFSFSMFGGGSRVCPGRNFAMIEMKLFLTLLYRKFDVEVADINAPLNLKASSITSCQNLDLKLTPK